MTDANSILYIENMLIKQEIKIKRFISSVGQVSKERVWRKVNVESKWYNICTIH